ncbi:MAG: folate family ECF transporter S component [Anaerovoracaceae bacterium]|nr:folate family ECF transporter S component [Anaerovoracaceae bacterium]
MKKSLTAQLVTMAFLIALEIVLTRFLSINLQFVRIGFGFVPVAIAAIMYGPLWAGAGYAIGDVLGMLIFPTGPYFPGFTLTAFIIGVIYGLFLHNRKINIPNVAAAVITVNVCCTLLLNTYWLTLLYGNATFIALLPTRIVEACVLAAVEVPVIITLWKNALVRIPDVRAQVSEASLQKGLR